VSFGRAEEIKKEETKKEGADIADIREKLSRLVDVIAQKRMVHNAVKKELTSQL